MITLERMATLSRERWRRRVSYGIFCSRGNWLARLFDQLDLDDAVRGREGLRERTNRRLLIDIDEHAVVLAVA